jgi:hypothetical protein
MFLDRNDLVSKLIGYPLELKCYKCDKVMSLIPKELPSNYYLEYPRKKLKVEIEESNELNGNQNKNFYIKLHYPNCSTHCSEIGCCTCDGSISKYFASCAKHSTEIIDEYNSYRFSILGRNIYTSHHYLHEKYPDCWNKVT